MSLIQKIALAITIIGGIAWALIGIFDFNIVTFIFLDNSFLTRTVYILVGISSILCISLFAIRND